MTSPCLDPSVATVQFSLARSSRPLGIERPQCVAQRPHGRARRRAAAGHDRSFNPQKRNAFERLLSGFILRIGMLAPLAGVGGIAATQYFPCRRSAFSDRAAVSNKSIAGWRPIPVVRYFQGRMAGYKGFAVAYAGMLANAGSVITVTDRIAIRGTERGNNSSNRLRCNFLAGADYAL